MTSPQTAERTGAPTTAAGHEWWRTAVIYQIYPRSFSDSSGDGVGDLPGITSRLDDLRDLGVDALWLSPFQRSPQKDAGYDVSDYCDVDPLFGTLADFDEMLAQAHARGIRLIVDLVPNHSSDQHEWFQQALAAAPGSAERARYMFRDGQGVEGELPPNNWESVFGGPAWTRVVEADGTAGQWYLHLFDSSQPDFDWSNEEVREEFRRVLRFWLDRGVDGFRVDVAHGLVKAEGLPDYTPDPETGSMGGEEANVPYWGQDGVHEVYRDWHDLLAEYDGDRALCAEAWLPTPEKTALWVRRDAPGFQLRVPRDGVGCRGSALRDRRVDRRLRRGRRSEHLGALEPRRGAARLAPGPDRREPAGSRHRAGLPREADPRGRTAPRPRRHDAHARAAGFRLPLPGRGTRPARGHRHPRRCAPGPDVVPHERRALRP
jgi:alpha-glucosidase